MALFWKLPCFVLFSLTCFLPRVETVAQAEILEGGAVETGEVSSLALIAQGKKFLSLQKWEEAVSTFKMALERDPKSVPAVIGLANASLYLGKREDALTELIQMAARIRGQDRQIIIKKAQILSRQFLTNRTFQLYQDGLNLLVAKKYRAARERFEKALAEEPDHGEILIRLGQSLLLDNQTKLAIERFNFAKKMNPFDPILLLWAGRAHHIQGVFTESLIELKMAQRSLPGSELATVWLAESLAASGQVSQSLRLLNRDIKSWPFHIASLTLGARLRVQLAHSDSQSLWTARKDLQLALSRMDQYTSLGLTRAEEELSLDLRKSQPELKAEIQKLLQQVQGRIDEISRDDD
jgi:tetratricopeptide (TPR) repeat protein